MKLKYFDIAANAPKIPAVDDDNNYQLCHILTTAFSVKKINIL